MRALIISFLASLLRVEARFVIRRYHPRIVGVTGSVGKTSTKDAIATVLGASFRTRGSRKSFNNELGVPLTILGRDTAGRSLTGWFRNIFEGLWLALGHEPYPEWLVLEIGADAPGDIRAVTKWLTFDIAVLTRLPETPVHVEFFSSVEELWNEKMVLPRSIAPGRGVVVLNHDDPAVIALKPELEGRHVISYGFHPEADVRASNESLLYEEDAAGKKTLVGMSFRVDYGGSTVPIRLAGTAGSHQIYALLAALAVGASQGLNIVTMAEACTRHEPPAGRLRILPAVRGGLILDDSYNSSPVALEAALRTLGEIKDAPRTIAVLGDMMELGEHTIPAHREAGKHVATVADFLITVGPRARFIAEAAEAAGLDRGHITSFDDALAAGAFLQNLLKPGDLVLVKGSQAVRLEKTVEEIMAEPERKRELLVRQGAEWQGK